MALALLCLAGTAGAATRPCSDLPSFDCTRITVPLDRTGTVAGHVSLRYATQRGVRLKKHVLLAFTGGPGSASVPFASSYVAGFGSILRTHSLVIPDVRGTGGSHPLYCPELQAIRGLDDVFPEDVAGCARRLGAARDSYATIDTADDLEALRRHLGVPKLALYGVSYGTWVAQQYARRYPTHVERLVLDSVVPPDRDPWGTASVRALPRVLHGLCARGACRGITTDPMADLTAIVRRIQSSGPGRGLVRTPRGVHQRLSLSQSDLLTILVSSDLNTPMQARIPAALAAGRQGDYAPLLRLERDASGPVSPLRQFSVGLFLTTSCLDTPLPYAYSDPFDVRAAKARAALAALPESAVAPFDRQTLDFASVPQICLHWPDGTFRAESAAPLPDVPTLILSGDADLRTPREGALALAREVPHPQVVTLAGSGHDVFDSDTTGCVARAVRRLFAGRAVGDPCRGKSVEPPLAPVPPRSLAAVRAVPGLPGARGRVLRAAVEAIADSQQTSDESYYAGFSGGGGGGLRSGHFESFSLGAATGLQLHHVAFVPGVAVTGTIGAAGSQLAGRLRVAAPRGLSGRLAFHGSRVSGTLGGRRVRTTLRVLERRPAARAAALRRARPLAGP